MESHNEMKVLFEFEPWVHVLVGLHIMISLDFANTHCLINAITDKSVC